MSERIASKNGRSDLPSVISVDTFESLDRFSLAWRFTTEDGTFTERTRNNIRPLSEADSARVWELVGPLAEELHNLDLSSFDSQASRSNQPHKLRHFQVDEDREEASEWLKQLPVQGAEEVLILWDSTTTVQASWAVFVEGFADFCYPSSDDVTVFPRTLEWVLEYMHDDHIVWSSREDHF